MKRRNRRANQSIQTEGLEARALLTTFTVDSLADTTADDDVLTLREAVQLANQNDGPDIIEITRVGRIKLKNGELFINDDLTIRGLGPTNTDIDGLGQTNILSVRRANLTVEDLKLRNGSAPNDRGAAIKTTGQFDVSIDNVRFVNNVAQLGGALSTGHGDISIKNSSFIENAATRDGGAIGPASGSRVTIERSFFTGNTASNSGGALYGETDGEALGIPETTYTISSSRFFWNESSTGGAIKAGDDISIETSQFTENKATNGGAVSSFGGMLTVKRSSFTGNTATLRGGAIYSRDIVLENSSVLRNSAGTRGGGIHANSATIRNSTIAENTAVDAGAGIANLSDSFTTTITSSIIALNSSDGSPSDIQGDFEIATSFVGTNSGTSLVATGLNATDADGNFIGSANTPIDPGFTSGMNSAGFPNPTSHFVPSSSSPVVGRGSNPEGLTIDQIGADRVSGSGGIDMGAVEYTSGLADIVNGVVTIDGTNDADEISVRLDTRAGSYVFVMNNSTTTAPIADVARVVVIARAGDDDVSASNIKVPIEIRGGGGNDTLVGGEAADVIGGGAGNDSLRGLAGDDTIDGWSGDDTIRGAQGADYIQGYKGHDLLYGGEDQDEIRGFSGNDTLFGGDGRDELLGGSGHDEISGEDGNDFVLAGNGNDTVSGGAGHDYIRGANGRDLLMGGGGADYLFGEGGSDTLRGGNSIDVLHGGKAVGDPPTAEAIDAAWRTSGPGGSTEDYDPRVNNVRRIFGGLDWAEAQEQAPEAIDDGAVDDLDGGAALDFFYVHVLGNNADVFDLQPGERRERV